MKFKKLIAAGLASVTLLSATATTVNAADKGSWITVKRSAPVYNKKGKKIYFGHGKYRKLSKARKDDTYHILGTKKIKNKKFYEIQKGYFLKTSDAKVTFEVNNKAKEKWPNPVWQSKHLVDTLPSLSDQIAKALSLQGEDRLEADKEIASQLGMLNKNGDIEIEQKAFEKGLQEYTQSSQSAKDVIEGNKNPKINF